MRHSRDVFWYGRECPRDPGGANGERATAPGPAAGAAARRRHRRPPGRGSQDGPAVAERTRALPAQPGRDRRTRRRGRGRAVAGRGRPAGGAGAAGRAGDGLPAPVGRSARGLDTAVWIGRARDRHPRLQRAVPRRGHRNPRASRRKGSRGRHCEDCAWRPRRAERCGTRRGRRHQRRHARQGPQRPHALPAAHHGPEHRDTAPPHRAIQLDLPRRRPAPRQPAHLRQPSRASTCVLPARKGGDEMAALYLDSFERVWASSAPLA